MNGSSAPEDMGLRFVRYQDQNRIMIEVNDTQYAGTHQVGIIASHPSDSSVYNTASYTFELTVIEPPLLEVANRPPEFVESDENGLALSPLENTLPDIIDPDGDPIQIAVFLTDERLEYDPVANSISVKDGVSLPPGEYPGVATASDDSPAGARVRQIPFTFVVAADPSVGGPGLIETYRSTPYDPIPRIKTLTSDGYCVIRWDKDMVLYSPRELMESRRKLDGAAIEDIASNPSQREL